MATASNSSLPACRCGHTRYHHHARCHPRYGFWASVLLASGATGTPKEITFTCIRCGEVIEQTQDPVVLREFENH